MELSWCYFWYKCSGGNFARWMQVAPAASWPCRGCCALPPSPSHEALMLTERCLRCGGMRRRLLLCGATARRCGGQVGPAANQWRGDICPELSSKRIARLVSLVAPRPACGPEAGGPDVLHELHRQVCHACCCPCCPCCPPLPHTPNLRMPTATARRVMYMCVPGSRRPQPPVLPPVSCHLYLCAVPCRLHVSTPRGRPTCARSLHSDAAGGGLGAAPRTGVCCSLGPKGLGCPDRLLRCPN